MQNFFTNLICFKYFLLTVQGFKKYTLQPKFFFYTEHIQEKMLFLVGTSTEIEV